MEDITEEDIKLVADNMTDKVYNSAIVSSEPVAPVLITETFKVFSLKTTSEPEPIWFWLPPGFHLPPVPSEDGGH